MTVLTRRDDARYDAGVGGVGGVGAPSRGRGRARGPRASRARRRIARTRRSRASWWWRESRTRPRGRRGRRSPRGCLCGIAPNDARGTRPPPRRTSPGGGSVGVTVRCEPRGFQDGFELPARRAASRRKPPARAISALAASAPTAGLHVRVGRPLQHPLVALRPGCGRVVGRRLARVVAPTTARRPTLESATHRRHRRRRRAARNANPAGVSSQSGRPTRGMFTLRARRRGERNLRDIFAPQASRS